MLFTFEMGIESNGSNHLQSVDGATADSVDVDLGRGAVTLRSEKAFDEIMLADVILQVGFKLVKVSETSATAQQTPQSSRKSVVLGITMDSGAFDDGSLTTSWRWLAHLPYSGYEDAQQRDQTVIVSVLAEFRST